MLYIQLYNKNNVL